MLVFGKFNDHEVADREVDDREVVDEATESAFAALEEVSSAGISSGMFCGKAPSSSLRLSQPLRRA